MKKIFIDGSEGTTGLKIYDRLKNRDDIELLTIDPALRKDPDERARLTAQSDITFLCLPDQAAIEAVQALPEGCDTVIIDTSTAHRTAPGWSYGFAELSPEHRQSIMTSKRIANPGCHASGFIALTYPLISAGLIDKDTQLCCFSLTGYSGGGKKMIAQYESEERDRLLDSPRQYGLNQQHKHLKEMKAVCGLNKEPMFSPIVADYFSGMEVTVYLYRDMFRTPADINKLYELYSAHYEGSNLIKVMQPGYEAQYGGFYAAGLRSGYDDMRIYINGNDDRMIVTAIFDNLGKGASGSAIQCMNISMGTDETKGLIL